MNMQISDIDRKINNFQAYIINSCLGDVNGLFDSTTIKSGNTLETKDPLCQI